MDNLTKVLFPVLSRLQHDKEKIRQLVEKIMFFQTALLSPAILGLALEMDDVIHVIPKYAKWAPALPLLYIFCVSAFFASFSSRVIGSCWENEWRLKTKPRIRNKILFFMSFII